MGNLSLKRLFMTRGLLPTLVATALVLAGCGNAPSNGTAPTTTTPTSTTSATTSTSATTAAPTSTTTSTASRLPTTSATATKTPSPTTTRSAGGASTPTAAIAAWMGKKGFRYAGECATTTLEKDIGKYCSSLCEDKGARRIYRIGPTFSEYTQWLLLERSGGTWRVIAAAKDTGTAPPPW
jgi:hypothetical protein